MLLVYVIKVEMDRRNVAGKRILAQLFIFSLFPRVMKDDRLYGMSTHIGDSHRDIYNAARYVFLMSYISHCCVCLLGSHVMNNVSPS